MTGRLAASLGFAFLAATFGGAGALAAGGAGTGPSASLQDLEEQVAATPNDLELRSQVLKAYFLETSPEARAARARHVLWVIANAPDAEIAGSPYAGFRRITEADAYEQARRLWLVHLEKDPPDLEVLWNASRFFFVQDPALATELLSRGAKLEPDSPGWRQKLAMRRMDSESVAPTERGPGALALLESALADADEAGRYHSLELVAQAALQAGEDGKARAYAEELLALSERLPPDWNYGNAVHDGNRLLGHVALRAGDVEAAKAFLLKAGTTRGSAVLNSFGPSLTLAADLLAKGERAAVVQYLRMCSVFWKGRGEAIDRWIADIRGGGTPELNRFLAYRAEMPTATSRR